MPGGMRVQGSQIDAQVPCDVAINEGFGWRRHRSDTVTVWFKGWMNGQNGTDIAKRFSKAGKSLSPALVADWLRDVEGHYALVAVGQGWAVATVDWVRSIPDRKSTRLNSSHTDISRMPSSA